MVGVGDEHRGELVEGDDAVGLRVVDLRHLSRRLQALVVRVPVMQRPGRAAAEDLQVPTAVEHGTIEAPPAEGGAEVARLVALLVDPRRLDLERQGQIGRASCRERVCQYVSFSLVDVSFKTNNEENKI